MSAEEALGGQYDLRSNLKNKPNAQGTLFQVASSARTPESRQPRGFSPERQREVTQAGSGRGMNPRVAYPPRAAATAAMRDTIARSTVPVEHLKDVSFYAASKTTDSARGYYLGPHQGLGNQIHLAPGVEHSNTVIHEIGHHVSAEHLGNEHAAYEHPEDQGTEEAFAENYADTHFRDRRGKPTAVPLLTGKAWVAGGARGGEYGGFLPAFNDERVHSPVVQKYRADQAAERVRSQIAPGQVKGQRPLLNKVTTKEAPSAHNFHGRADLVDWDYSTEPHADPDSTPRRETSTPSTDVDIARRKMYGITDPTRKREVRLG